MNAKVIVIGDVFSLSEKKHLNLFILKIAHKVSKLLKIKNKSIYFTVYRFNKYKINGGFKKAKDWIEITIPPGKMDYKDLEGILYHEMHHIARGYSGMMERGELSLLDTVFSEGLATAFEVEQVPHRLPKYARHTPSLIKKWLPRMAQKFSSTKFNYREWFHGQGKPKQLGYKIGKYLVDEIIKRNPSQTPSTLARIDSKKLLKMSGY